MGIYRPWSQLLALTAKQASNSLTTLAEYGRRDLPFNASGEVEESVPGACGRIAEPLARVAVLCGAEVCNPAIDIYAPFLDAGVQQLTKLSTRQRAALTPEYMAFRYVVHCCRPELVPWRIEDEAERLRAAARGAGHLRYDRAMTASFGCLATQQPRLVPGFIGGTLETSWQTPQQFRLHAEALVRWLASAQALGASGDAILPAWRELLEVFPRYVATSGVQFRDLLLCAYAVYVHFQQLTPARVLDELRGCVSVLP